mmetsp:Transcript_35126/g.83309  ORF Transcript_35126/g.83309 Transcript_35126/m.83309 type:complete len:258 (-) Transcript_35126:971-1744(-)
MARAPEDISWAVPRRSGPLPSPWASSETSLLKASSAVVPESWPLSIAGCTDEEFVAGISKWRVLGRVLFCSSTPLLSVCTKGPAVRLRCPRQLSHSARRLPTRSSKLPPERLCPPGIAPRSLLLLFAGTGMGYPLLRLVASVCTVLGPVLSPIPQASCFPLSCRSMATLSAPASPEGFASIPGLAPVPEASDPHGSPQLCVADPWFGSGSRRTGRTVPGREPPPGKPSFWPETWSARTSSMGPCGKGLPGATAPARP